MKCGLIWKRRRVLLAILVCVLLCLGIGIGQTQHRPMSPKSERNLPPGLQRVLSARTQEERATARRELEFDSYMTDASLEMREQQDSLLTPALLVQEAVSDGVILTYPEE